MIKPRTSFGMPSSVARGRARILLGSSLVLSSWLAFMPAYGAGLLFLKDAPARFFSEEDWRLLKKGVRRTLEEVPDGETSSWQNPATGSAGAMKPLKTYQDNGTKCRTLEIYNRAAGRTGQSVLDFCKQADGTWKTGQ
jgi:surface antigen